MKNFSVRLWMIYMLLNCFTVMFAQNTLSTNIRTESRQFFSEKDYTRALPLYRELLNSFPKEPEYQYCTGVCLIQNRGDLDEAIRLLRPIGVAEYSYLSIYYLGRAQHLNYAFDDAIKAYSRFLLKAKKEETEAYQVERLIEMARNGIEYTRTGRSVQVLASQPVLLDQLQSVAEITGSGKLMKKPLEFCSKTDIRHNFRPWMFLPAYTEINEYVYVAGYEIGKKNNSQLFRIKNINHSIWGFPEPLNQEINTPYDEEYPYFDTKTSTLYFSSIGHSSMGGYDIFKSVYDWNTKTWSKPENMGFPINSPYDDFIFIPDELNQTASFASTRNSGPNKADIFRIKFEKDPEIIRFQGPDDLRNASIMPVISRSSAPAWKSDSLPDTISPSDAGSTSISHAITDLPDKYNKVLAEALLLQVKADSAARITRDLRIQAKENPDEIQKKQLVSDIIKYDKIAKSLQREADLKFAEARNLKSGESANKQEQDTILVLSKEINGIRVYQYREGLPEQSNDTQAVEPEEQPVAPQAIPEKETRKDEFLLSEKLAYDDTNPIPMVSTSITGLVYRVQLGVFSNARANDAFGGISPVAFEVIQGKSIHKYYAGVFYSHTGAVKALEAIRSKGFPDAFIVAFVDGKLITTEKAREIEFSEYKLY